MSPSRSEKPVSGPEGLLEKTALGKNLAAAIDQSYVDELNAEFYGKIKYPWPTAVFDRFFQKGFWSKMLAQDIGSWDRPVVPENGTIWVAGCGTNQALLMALKFPEAKVIGTDISNESLAVCRHNATQIGAANLELRKESINEAKYIEEFDYVLCTGVIHHNADPTVPLSRLSKALKPLGVLELMVYNQYHRIKTSAFQAAIRLLLGTESRPDLESELPVAKEFVRSFTNSSSMSAFLKAHEEVPDAAFCDALLQPVEHSFSLGALDDLAKQCNLELLTFAIDQFSKSRGAIDWNLTLSDPELRRLYDSLPDTKRWQITNHLMLEDSPMLWFYLQRRDCRRPRKTEQEICHEFSERTFQRATTEFERYIRHRDGTYQKFNKCFHFPGKPRLASALALYDNFDDLSPLNATFLKMQIENSFHSVNTLRITLATSAYPFLVSR